MNRLVDLFRSGSQLFFGKIKKSKWKSERERKREKNVYFAHGQKEMT